MSTREIRHIEMDQILAHGCIVAWKKDVRPVATIHSRSSIFASTGEV
jgi:hypothetical protein